MLVAAVLAFLGFFGWLVFRIVDRRRLKPYMVSYALAIIAAAFAFAFFLGMNVTPLFKVLVSLALGIVLIVLAATLLLRRRPAK